MQDTLQIRADAGPEIGTGHVMRCLALAQGWQDAGGAVVFASGDELPGGLEQRLRSEGFEVERIRAQVGSAEDASLTSKTASRVNAAWTVIDGYTFGPDYQQALRDAGQKLLVIDDHARLGRYSADLVLDQNCGASEALYAHREPNTRLLLGTQHALLRREFQPWREWQREYSETARNVLVTMGGADPDNLTIRVIEALKRTDIEGLDITVLAGAANWRMPELKSAVRGHGAFRLLPNAANVPSLMARADVGIICAGGTLWELLFMGAAVLSYSREPVHASALSELESGGAASWLGPVNEFDESRLLERITHVLTQRACRERMSRNARTVVDGFGVQRVLQAMGVCTTDASRGVRMISISRAEKNDFMAMASRYFSELNPSFTPHTDWKEHYFENIQSSPDHFLRWLVDGAERAGFILFGIERHRFLPRETGVIHDLYVAPEHRKKGIARTCASQAIAELRSLSPSKIQLETMQGNGNAAALWRSLGFQKTAERFVLEGGTR